MSEHSTHSFSGSDRWIEGHCPASIRMSRGYPSLSNPSAEKGTCAHALGEFSYSIGLNIRDCLGLTFNNIKVDHKMIDDVSIYTGYMAQQEILYGVKPKLEKRVVMSSMGRDDVFGTCDCLFDASDNGVVEAADYKNGYGVVDVANNSQTIGYVIAALDTFNLWDKVTTVKNTIIQPNGNHRDGPVRSAVYTIHQMREWQEKFRRSIALTEDRTQRPNAGDWCQYCPAQANCRARIEYVLDHAYLNVPFEELSVPELEIIYHNVSSIKTFLEKVENRMFSLAMKGQKFKDLKVVASYGRAECKDESALVQAALTEGVDKDDLFNAKLKSKTDLKRLLPHSLVNSHFVSPEPGKKLVPMYDNSPALRINSVEGVFDAFKLNQ